MSPGRTLLPAAHHLIAHLSSPSVNSYHFAIQTAIKTTFTPRDPIKPQHPDSWLELMGKPAFAQVADYKALMTIIYAMLDSGGFGNYQPVVPEYVDDPIMTIDEMINEALGEYIKAKLPPPEAYKAGEKTSYSMFSQQVLQVVQEIATLSKKKAIMLDHFQRHIGNLLYQMYDGTIDYKSLDPVDKTWLAVYVYNQDPKYRHTDIGGSALPLRFPVARDADPVVLETIVRLRSVCMPGTWLNFTKIISNGDPAELMYIVAPVVDKLNICTGKRTDRGPYTDIKWAKSLEVQWGAELQLAAFRQRVTFDSDADDEDRYLNTGYRRPVRNLDHMNVPLLTDGLNVHLNFQAVSPTSDRLVASWNSKSLDLLMTDLHGATADQLLNDEARETTSSGSVALSPTEMSAFGRMDLTHPSMQSRFIQGLFTRQQRNRIVERVYYVKQGLLQSANVEMTNFYLNQGDVGFRPALVEHMEVPRTYFERPIDDAARAYIEGKLQLTQYDKTDGAECIAISHNIAEFERLTGHTADIGMLPLPDLLQARTQTPQGPTFSNPPTIQ